MDLFNKKMIQGNFQQDNDFHQNNLSQTPIVLHEGAPWGGFDQDWRPSWLERLFGKGAGVLKRISMLFICGAGLGLVIALFFPFIKFLSLFSDWLSESVERIFY